MARKRGAAHRRRRGRFSFLLRLLCILIIISAAVAALTLFFRVQHIEVSGCARYSAQEIIDASGIETEDNLFLLNKYSVAQTIFERLPYVEEAAINRDLPDTIVITVRECTAAAGLETDAGLWLVSENGKLLEEVSAVPSGCPTVYGIEPESPAQSAQLSTDGEDGEKVAMLLSLLSTARERAMLADIESIDLRDAEAVYLRYLGRFTVKFPWDCGADTVLRGTEEVVTGELESNQTGEISFMNLASKGWINFIPDT